MQIDDASANDVMAQLLTLESLDPDRDITMYINSPGGSFTAMTAIYDTMQFVRPDIQTVCLGQAASAAAVLLAAGTPGKRLALPNSRIIIHQPATEGGYGQGSRHRDPGPRDPADARAAGGRCWPGTPARTVEQVRKDIDRDKILTAEEAKEYGLIDDIILASRKKRRSRPVAVLMSCAASERCPIGHVPGATRPHRWAH